jgi:hypothetical protein
MANDHPQPREAYINAKKMLADALDKAKKEHGGMGLVEHAVREAYNNPMILQCILKKILPDKTESDINSKEIILQLVQYGQNGVNSQISVIPQKNGIENKPLYIGNQQKEEIKPITDFKFEVLDVKVCKDEEKQEESKEVIKEEPKTLKD